MESQIANSWIDRYFENDLSEAEKELFDKSLKRNALLREELQIDEQLNHFFEDRELLLLRQKIQVIAHKPYFRMRKFALNMMVASVSGIIFFILTYYLIHNESPDKLQTHEKPKSTLAAVHKENANPNEMIVVGSNKVVPSLQTESMVLTAADENSRYQPLIEYEVLVGAVTRNSGITVIEPAPDLNVTLDETVNFSISTRNPTGVLTIVVMNNLGEKVYSASFPEHETSFRIETVLVGRGLFYWKLLEQDEMIMVGKFKVF